MHFQQKIGADQFSIKALMKLFHYYLRKNLHAIPRKRESFDNW